MQYLETKQPDGFVVMTGLGSMGQSIGAAIGAQLANPTRTVAAICGDGCFAMNAFEIATAVAERAADPRVRVQRRRARHGREGPPDTSTDGSPDYPTGPVGPLDVCAIARGLGAMTLLRRRYRPARSGREQLLHDYPGPVVIDVRIDPGDLHAS